LDLSIHQKTQEQEQLAHQIKVFQGRLELSPVIQQEFKALTRDYQTALSFYNDLLKRRNESQMATDLESSQQAEKFRVLDPPSLPVRPSFPNRQLFGLGGLCAGLTLGLGIVHFSESRDKSIRTRQDVETYLAVPMLTLISQAGGAKGNRGWTNGAVRARRTEFSWPASSWK
jgi:uncharacterized protein involved in exopolysaccharide biosynthesis